MVYYLGGAQQTVVHPLCYALAANAAAVRVVFASSRPYCDKGRLHVEAQL